VADLQGKSRLAFWALVFVTAVLPSCGEYVNFPAPIVTSLSPVSVPAGQPQFTLKVFGKQLTPSSIVQWNPGTGAVPLVTIFQNENQTWGIVPASFVQNPGTAMITVFTPSPGGGTSAALTFTITPVASPIPEITGLQPSQVLVGGAGFTLTITGRNFVPTSFVTVNNSNRQASFQDSTSLQVAIAGSDIAQTGMLEIAVVNPPPDGGTSDPVPLSVQNPVPTISMLSPSSAMAGSTITTTLTVVGTGLVSGSQILINGGPRTTATASAASLTTQLTSGDFGAGGVDQVQVMNPGPGGGISNILTFAVNPTATVGLPVILDLAPDGSLANNGVCGTTCSGGVLNETTAGPSTSNNGQFVAYASISSNLVTNNANTSSDIYVRNTCLAVASCTPLTTIVSTDPNGNSANGASSEPSINSAGNEAAFTSTATNLTSSVPQSGLITQVFWRPVCSTTATCTGSASGAQLVSMGADGVSAGNGPSYNPTISSDGQFVAFVSLATNLVSNVTFDGVTPQVFVRQTCGGVISNTCTPTTFLVSTNGNAPNGVVAPSNGAASNPSVATNGLFVSFTSSATNLGPGAPNPNGLPEVFVRGCTFTASTCLGQALIASTPDGATAANAPSSESAISPDGRYVIFSSTATNLGVASGGIQQIYARDTCTNSTVTTCTPSTTLISTTNGTTPGNAISEHPSISEVTTVNVQPIIAFASLASNLGGNTANGVENIIVRQTCLGITTACAPTTIVASQAGGNSPPSSNGSSLIPSVSGDGHSVSFISFSTDLVTLPTNGLSNIFLASTTF
jgi:WD40-like Beta Propeller Repeat